MKKLNCKILIILSLISFISCKGKNSEKSAAITANLQPAPEYQERTAISGDMDFKNQITFESLKKFFTLDYTPEYPDTVFAESEDSNKKTDSTSSSKDSQKSESVIPGTRKLSDYVTKYITKKSELKDYKPKSTAIQEEADDDNTKDFFIEDWGPQGSVVAGENHPTFYIIFSRPARSLSALDKPQTTSDIMSIEPALPGVFRWYGTKHLSFESDIPADPTVHYTIKVKNDIKSAGGKPLTGDTVFVTDAEPLEVINLWGGYIKKK